MNETDISTVKYILTPSGAPIKRAGMPVLLVDADGNEIKAGDMVEFRRSADEVYPSSGFIFAEPELKIQAFDMMFNRWYSYKVVGSTQA